MLQKETNLEKKDDWKKIKSCFNVKDKKKDFQQRLYRVCHGFRLTNRVAYFRVNFDLF
jgi:hypothetical protein